MGVLAKRYAKAFFAKASESKEERLLISELLVLGTIFNQSDVKTVLSKRFSIEEQKAFLQALFLKLGSSQLTARLVLFLLQKGRIEILAEICGKLQQMLDKKDGIERVRVSSKRPLSDQELEELKGSLQVAVNGKVVFDVKTDPSLIAGLVVYIRDICYDGSLKTQLSEMKKHLVSVV